MKNWFLLIVFFLVFSYSCRFETKTFSDNEYAILNEIINSRAENILDNRFFINSKSILIDNAEIVDKYLKGIGEFSDTARELLLKQIANNCEKQFDRNQFLNDNLELVDNFVPTESDYYLQYSEPVFSKDSLKAFVLEKTYYWGKDTITYYLLEKSDKDWQLLYMDNWKMKKTIK
jgi:hypothetical protein